MIRKSRLLSGRGKKRLKIEMFNPNPLGKSLEVGDEGGLVLPLKNKLN